MPTRTKTRALPRAPRAAGETPFQAGTRSVTPTRPPGGNGERPTVLMGDPGLQVVARRCLDGRPNSPSRRPDVRLTAERSALHGLGVLHFTA